MFLFSLMEEIEDVMSRRKNNRKEGGKESRREGGKNGRKEVVEEGMKEGRN